MLLSVADSFPSRRRPAVLPIIFICRGQESRLVYGGVVCALLASPPYVGLPYFWLGTKSACIGALVYPVDIWVCPWVLGSPGFPVDLAGATSFCVPPPPPSWDGGGICSWRAGAAVWLMPGPNGRRHTLKDDVTSGLPGSASPCEGDPLAFKASERIGTDACQLLSRWCCASERVRAAWSSFHMLFVRGGLVKTHYIYFIG